MILKFFKKQPAVKTEGRDLKVAEIDAVSGGECEQVSICTKDGKGGLDCKVVMVCK